MAKPYNEIYPDGDAASRYEEGNDASIWLVGNGSTNRTSVDSGVTPPESGIYCISIENGDAGLNRYAKNLITFIDGVNYSVEIYAKRGPNGTEQIIQVYGLDGVTKTLAINSTSWELYSFSGVADTATAGEIRAFANQTVYVLNDTCYIDSISILNLDAPPPTTTVEIEWIDSISAAVIGHKVYRDTVPSTGEVELADVGLGVQFYADATALPGTEYKYEVQAYSSTFETISEQVTINVRTITTAS